MVPDQRFQAAASYSLRSPPGSGRHRSPPSTGSGTGDLGVTSDLVFSQLNGAPLRPDGWYWAADTLAEARLRRGPDPDHPRTGPRARTGASPRRQHRTSPAPPPRPDTDARARPGDRHSAGTAARLDPGAARQHGLGGRPHPLAEIARRDGAPWCEPVASPATCSTPRRATAESTTMSDATRSDGLPITVAVYWPRPQVCLVRLASSSTSRPSRC